MREVLVWTIGLVAVLGIAGEAAAEESGDRLLRHVVMYKFKASVSDAQVQEAVDTFAALPDQIDTIVAFEHGTNVSEEQKSEGFTHLFLVTFRDQQGLKTYLDHKAHLAYVEVVRDRREKVIVFDYWIDAKGY